MIVIKSLTAAIKEKSIPSWTLCLATHKFTDHFVRLKTQKVFKLNLTAK